MVRSITKDTVLCMSLAGWATEPREQWCEDSLHPPPVPLASALDPLGDHRNPVLLSEQAQPVPSPTLVLPDDVGHGADAVTDRRRFTVADHLVHGALERFPEQRLLGAEPAQDGPLAHARLGGDKIQ